MDKERRKFLQQLAALCGAGVARTLGVGLGAGTVAVAATATATTAAVASAATAFSPYGAGVRQQVFEVIVRQAMAGAPWQEICKGPMAVNSITEDQIKAEVIKRRLVGHIDKLTCSCEKCLRQRRDRNLDYQQRVDAIAHSTISPCACKDCRVAIGQILETIRSEVFPAPKKADF